MARSGALRRSIRTRAKRRAQESSQSNEAVEKRGKKRKMPNYDHPIVECELRPGSSSSQTSGDNEEVNGDEAATMCGLTDLVSQCLTGGAKSRASSAQIGIVSGTNEPQPFLRSSLFSNIPPTVRFYTKGTKVSKPNRKLCGKLTWCYNSLLPIVMRNSLAASHFKIVDESLEWVGYWGRHLKSAQYKSIKPFQKVNHFPGAFHIGRKDRLWMHISEMQEKWGSEFEIIPYTYVLPKDLQLLKNYLDEDPNNHIILKPPASARGTGITVTRKLKEIPAKTPLIAQHYVDRPMTINNAKFDLRLYVYIPCLEPLRVYIYDEGLVRFASVPYSKCVSTVSNKYMHLTNYSINKLAEADGVADCPVPKWRLSELWSHLEDCGFDSEKIRVDIDDVIIKAVIACEKPIRDHMSKHITFGFVCHELFGIDILLDENARPWLLEVNISPSLHSGTALDISVKAPLAKDVLNLAGIQVPGGTESLYSTDFSEKPRNWPKEDSHIAKEHHWVRAWEIDGDIDPRIGDTLSAEDVRTLCEFEDEYRRRGDFRLLFPTAETTSFQLYFAEPVYANLLLQHWQIEQEECRASGIRRLENMCREGYLTREDDLNTTECI